MHPHPPIDEFKVGSLVTVRNRPWIVMPSADQDILMLKPLGGTDAEITGLYKPLIDYKKVVKSYDLGLPTVNDIGDFAQAKLLYDATRLSFRNAAGPFRCLSKLSFRPRSYQMVPLMMALKLDVVRLLIADDVGIGKTIEALLIAKELLDRGEIKHFAVVCPPHLCEQWQAEIRDKIGLDAVIVRSGTVSQLNKQLRAGETIFTTFQVQVVSIDFIKGDKKSELINHHPDLIVVDEAHTCTRPEGATNSQQQRFELLRLLADISSLHIVLLTATPHSGKQEEFKSLLGLLNKEFETGDLATASSVFKAKVAQHFVQRRRADIKKWLNEETAFPHRATKDLPYIQPERSDYYHVFQEVLDYARGLAQSNTGDTKKQRFSYWEALALLRGVMSSPPAGAAMLVNKTVKKLNGAESANNSIEYDEDLDAEALFDSDLNQDDEQPTALLNILNEPGNEEAKTLHSLAARLQKIDGPEADQKLARTKDEVADWLKKGFNPIIFCRYIRTAEYVGKHIKELFEKKNKVQVDTITGLLADDQRKQKVEELTAFEGQRILIATDCLSEGINLQEGFNAILHYDLPWNPNRLEQREGRVDRFGQTADSVQVGLLYGTTNPVDGAVLKVLLWKTIEIRKSTGIAVPFPENHASIMDTLTKTILLKQSAKTSLDDSQMALFDMDEFKSSKSVVEKALEEAQRNDKAIRSVFAQNSLKPEAIEEELQQMDQAMGNVAAVERFVINSLEMLGCSYKSINKGYEIVITNLHKGISNEQLTPTSKKKGDNKIKISFQSPTPKGYRYIGRNHPFTEALCRHMVSETLHGTSHTRPPRVAVVKTNKVAAKTTIIQFRVRNVIEQLPEKRQVVAEELWLWGYRQDVQDQQFLTYEEAEGLLLNAGATDNLTVQEQAYWLETELDWTADKTRYLNITNPIGIKRAKQLAMSHNRVRAQLKSKQSYKEVEPVLPMDVLGLYILLPG